MQQLIDYRALSERWSMPLGTIYSMVSRGQIPHVRLGPRTVRFDPAELELWLQQRIVGTEDAVRNPALER
jgi:excisionase family DNA binding protein